MVDAGIVNQEFFKLAFSKRGRFKRVFSKRVFSRHTRDRLPARISKMPIRVFIACKVHAAMVRSRADAEVGRMTYTMSLSRGWLCRTNALCLTRVTCVPCVSHCRCSQNVSASACH